MPIKKLTLGLILFFIISHLHAQDIDDLLNENMQTESNFASATFKSTRIINAHSIEQVKKNHLDFRISHRFGSINSGAKNFFGIDQSTIHLSFEYGLSDRLTIGIGRSSYQKTFDGFLKYQILKQQTGKRNIPITLNYFVSTELFTSDFSDLERDNYFSSRLTYVHQILIGRKFNENFSFQLSPSLIHKNLVPTVLDMNDLFAIGIGGRYKLNKRIALTAEYFYSIRFPRSGSEYYDPISVGIDIETGGHVFQIMLSNTSIMREGGFIYGTGNDNFFKGGIHLGFNINRTFSLNHQ